MVRDDRAPCKLRMLCTGGLRYRAKKPGAVCSRFGVIENSSRSASASKLKAAEGMDCFFLAGNHFVGRRLALHGAGDGLLGGFIVELIDLFVVLGFPVDEDAADDDEIFALIL